MITMSCSNIFEFTSTRPCGSIASIVHCMKNVCGVSWLTRVLLGNCYRHERQSVSRRRWP